MLEPAPHLPVWQGGVFMQETVAGFCSKTLVGAGMPVQVPEMGYLP
jgi:hypothetical protein